MKVCKKCNTDKEIEEHHVQPKFMDNPKGYGSLIDFCKKHHHILHLIIPSIIWKYVPEKYKLKVIKEVESFTLKYCENNKDQKLIKRSEEDGRYCGNGDCCYELDEEDCIDGICPYCLGSINKEDDDYVKYY